MGIDRTTTGFDRLSENVERTPATDRPPPPPPDKPGSEGYPSRADSRAGAAAANATERSDATSANEQRSGHDTTAESSNAKRAAKTDRDTNPKPANEPSTDAQHAVVTTKESKDVRSRVGTGGERTSEQPAVQASVEKTEINPLPREDVKATTVDAKNHRRDGAPFVDQGGEELSHGKRRIDFIVGDKSLREYIDPLIPDDPDSGVGVEAIPRDDRITDEDGIDNDKLSRAERFRRKLAHDREDALEGIGSTTDKVKGIFDRPPTGSHSVVKPDQPMVTAQQNAVNADDVATALVSGAIVLGELYRIGRDKIAKRIGDRNGDK